MPPTSNSYEDRASNLSSNTFESVFTTEGEISCNFAILSDTSAFKSSVRAANASAACD
jgi:hypothetical protein